MTQKEIQAMVDRIVELKDEIERLQEQIKRLLSLAGISKEDWDAVNSPEAT